MFSNVRKCSMLYSPTYSPTNGLCLPLHPFDPLRKPEFLEGVALPGASMRYKLRPRLQRRNYHILGIDGLKQKAKNCYSMQGSFSCKLPSGGKENEKDCMSRPGCRSYRSYWRGATSQQDKNALTRVSRWPSTPAALLPRRALRPAQVVKDQGGEW